MTDLITIAMAFDGAYAPHAAGVVASIRRHSASSRFRFIILQSGLDPLLRARIESVDPSARFDWIDIDESAFPELRDRGHINRTTLYRLGLERLAPADCGRIIYLDSDLTVCADLRDLWETDLGGLPLGAVIDPGMDGATFGERWGLSAPGDYFNAGVLLIDMEAVRREKLFTTAFQFQCDKGPELPYSDQDALNWAFWNKWLRLDNSWNVQRVMILREPVPGEHIKSLPRRTEARVVHYTTEHKPWLPQSWHPWSWMYWSSLSRTPFFSEVARQHGFGAGRRFRTWLTWLRRRPANL